MLTGSGKQALYGTLTANAVRNVWAHAVIFCGHFPEGTDTFTEEMVEGETRGDWYVRQMIGSANISGSKFMHLMTGNLSHQIEHHLFPDIPSNRYAEVAPKVREICRVTACRTPPDPSGSRSVPPGPRSSSWHCRPRRPKRGAH